MLWLNLNNIGEISILQSAHKQGIPPTSLSCAALKTLKQPRLSKNISPVGSNFVLVIASDMHFESESEKRAKNVDFHTAKNIQIQPTLFRYF